MSKYEQPACPPPGRIQQILKEKKPRHSKNHDVLYAEFLQKYGELDPKWVGKAATPEEALELDRIANEWERRIKSLPPYTNTIR